MRKAKTRTSARIEPTILTRFFLAVAILVLSESSAQAQGIPDPGCGRHHCQTKELVPTFALDENGDDSLHRYIRGEYTPSDEEAGSGYRSHSLHREPTSSAMRTLACLLGIGICLRGGYKRVVVAREEALQMVLHYQPFMDARMHVRSALCEAVVLSMFWSVIAFGSTFAF